jgi:hypothetical protein
VNLACRVSKAHREKLAPEASKESLELMGQKVTLVPKAHREYKAYKAYKAMTVRRGRKEHKAYRGQKGRMASESILRTMFRHGLIFLLLPPRVMLMWSMLMVYYIYSAA